MNIRNLKQIIAPVLAVIAAVILPILGYLYISSMQKSLWSQLVQDITEVTAQGGHAFETYINKERESVERLSANLNECASDDKEKINALMDVYSHGDGIFSLLILDENGGDLYIADSDKVERLSAEEVESRFGDYGESGVTKPYINSYTGQLTLGYYDRITFTDGKSGIVRKGQLFSYIRNEFSLSFYNHTGFSYIVNGDGDIMVRSSHKNSNRTFSNIIDVIKLNGNDLSDIDKLTSSMKEKKRGAMRFRFNDDDYIFAFVPLNEINDWYIVSTIPNDSIVGHSNKILKTSQTLVVIIVLVIAVVAAFVLITYFYRKRVSAKETEVKYREQLFGLLAQTTDDVFLMLSCKDFAVEYVSPNIERVLGVSPAEVKTDLDVLGKTKCAGGDKVDYEEFKNLPADGSANYERERAHNVTGERKYFYETVYRVPVDASEKLIIVLSDRTSERQTENALKDALESAKAANKAKSMFLSNMSHDIRTPMNAIIGFTELIKRDANDSEKVLQHTNKISSSGQHLLGLINDILDMSKIENGKTVLNVSEINLAELAEELDDIIRPQAKAKEQDFKILAYNIKEERLLADKLRINQILINILSNAVKYTPVGGKIVMEIRELPRVNENFAHLCFTVTDNGIGMSEDYLQTIFQPFTREVSSTVNQIQGTGLGMAITKNLVELMGGSISVESEQGKGSSFRVELELRISDEAAEQEFWTEHGIHKALVIDDSPEICESVVGAFEGAGIKAQSVLDGEAAVTEVKTANKQGNDYDLILVDMRMPGMNGIETTKKIRETVSKKVSVMLLTAYDWSGFESEAIEAGIDAFLPKPFFLSNLKQTIRKIHDKKNSEGQDAGREQSLTGRRFLAAEDNELNSEILVELLDMIGVKCEVAVNGKQALEMFEKSEEGYYDAVLMDIQMPVMNGYEAAEAIRASAHSQAKDIPIIAMTANAFAEDINNALKAGMNAHIAKPVDMARLESVLKQLLNVN